MTTRPLTSATTRPLRCDLGAARVSAPDLGPRSVVLLGAPRAGGASAALADAVARGMRSAGHHVTVVPPGTPAQVREVARTLLTSPGGGSAAGGAHPAVLVLVVVGGDGTVQLGADAAAGTGVPLFIVPAGSGNDAARALGVPRLGAPQAAGRLHHLLTTGATPRPVDVMSVSAGGAPPRSVVSVIAAGFDAAVNARANAWAHGPTAGARRSLAHRIPPRARYTAAVLAELPSWRPRTYRLELDGVVHEVDASLVAVANTTSYGGGMRIAPAARTDDGLADVVVVAALGRAGLLALLPTAFLGQHVRHRAVTVHRAAHVRLSVLDHGSEPLPHPHGDGEELGPAPLDVQVLGGAVGLLT